MSQKESHPATKNITPANGSTKPARHTTGMSESKVHAAATIDKIIRVLIRHGVSLVKEQHASTCNAIDGDHGYDIHHDSPYAIDEREDDLKSDEWTTYYASMLAGQIAGRARANGMRPQIEAAVQDALGVSGLAASFDPHGIVCWTIANLAKTIPDNVHKVVAHIYEHLHHATAITCTVPEVIVETKLSKQAATKALKIADERKLVAGPILIYHDDRRDDDDHGIVQHYMPVFPWWVTRVFRVTEADGTLRVE